ncbi:hypothetical protein L873DRAFT_1812623 [Choiromyces venosus 120613-1]|uniref:Uncharacterized protein n=1 Tax=Choiromyces venosus 120613-1 TaxID=1336337 RepID=A0A3N4JG12_9PEZI|nr:hypothetical protein L873DRAFT_1812623 [Choiromyces venosus 120613-1]
MVLAGIYMKHHSAKPCAKPLSHWIRLNRSWDGLSEFHQFLRTDSTTCLCEQQK